MSTCDRNYEQGVGTLFSFMVEGRCDAGERWASLSCWMPSGACWSWQVVRIRTFASSGGACDECAETDNLDVRHPVLDATLGPAFMPYRV